MGWLLQSPKHPVPFLQRKISLYRPSEFCLSKYQKSLHTTVHLSQSVALPPFFRYCLSLPLAGLTSPLPTYFWKVTAHDWDFALHWGVTRILLAVLILKSCTLAREDSFSGFLFFTLSILFLRWNMLSGYRSCAQLTKDDAELSPSSEHWLQLCTFPTVGCCLHWSRLLLDGLAPVTCPLMSSKCQLELPGV